MNGIISWVKQIFVLSILSGLVIHLMPSSKYEQYIRFICGIVITAACITPFISLIAGENSVWDSYRSILNMQDVEELRQELKFSAGEGDEALLQQYEQAAVSVVEKKVLDLDLYPVKTDIVMDTDSESADYGAVQQLNLTVSLSKEGKQQDKIIVEKVQIAAAKKDQQGEEEGLVIDPKVTELKNALAQDYQLSLSNVNIQVEN